MCICIVGSCLGVVTALHCCLGDYHEDGIWCDGWRISVGSRTGGIKPVRSTARLYLLVLQPVGGCCFSHPWVWLRRNARLSQEIVVVWGW